MLKLTVNIIEPIDGKQRKKLSANSVLEDVKIYSEII